MSAETVIITAFRQIVASEPIERITIQEICAKAQVARKTFYTHFRDKDALLKHVIHADLIKPLLDLRAILPTDSIKSAPQLLTETIYRNILAHRHFYRGLLAKKGAGRSQFSEIVIRGLSQININAMQNSHWGDTEKEYYAYFFSAAQAMVIIKWVEEGMQVSPEQLAKIYNVCLHGAHDKIFEQRKKW